jgi:hypothetical protein
VQHVVVALVVSTPLAPPTTLPVSTSSTTMVSCVVFLGIHRTRVFFAELSLELKRADMVSCVCTAFIVLNLKKIRNYQSDSDEESKAIVDIVLSVEHRGESGVGDVVVVVVVVVTVLYCVLCLNLSV